MSGYLTPDIFLCRQFYEPKGICAKKVCKAKKLKYKTVTLTQHIKVYCNGVLISDTEKMAGIRTEIDAYMVQDGAQDQEMTVYMLTEGDNPACMTGFPPCSDISAPDADVKWALDGQYIQAQLPLPDSCGVEKFMTVFSEESVRYDTPGHLGGADGEDVSLTFDTDGYLSHKTAISGTDLIPGKNVSVLYKLKGFSEYHPLAYIDFQTNIFTSAVLIGAGIVTKEKVYEYPERPDLGYTYEYVPSEGGIGSTLSPEWIYDTSLRLAVEYREETYWLRPADFTDFKIGGRVTVIKSTDILPLEPSENITDKDSADTLSEDNDMITQDYFFG